MTNIFAKNIKKIILGGVCVCFMSGQNAGAQEAQTSISLAEKGSEQLAMLTDHKNQAMRRAWLAKMRTTLELDQPDPDAVIVEEINEEPVLAQNEYPRDFLNDYVVTISEEISQSQK